MVLTASTRRGRSQACALDTVVSWSRGWTSSKRSCGRTLKSFTRPWQRPNQLNRWFLPILILPQVYGAAMQVSPAIMALPERLHPPFLGGQTLCDRNKHKLKRHYSFRNPQPIHLVPKPWTLVYHLPLLVSMMACRNLSLWPDSRQRIIAIFPVCLVCPQHLGCLKPWRPRSTMAPMLVHLFHHRQSI